MSMSTITVKKPIKNFEVVFHESMYNPTYKRAEIQRIIIAKYKFRFRWEVCYDEHCSGLRVEAYNYAPMQLKEVFCSYLKFLPSSEVSPVHFINYAKGTDHSSDLLVENALTQDTEEILNIFNRVIF